MEEHAAPDGAGDFAKAAENDTEDENADANVELTMEDGEKN